MTDVSINELGPVDHLIVAAAVKPGPSPVAKTAVAAAAVTPGRRRRRI